MVYGWNEALVDVFGFFLFVVVLFVGGCCFLAVFVICLYCGLCVAFVDWFCLCLVISCLWVCNLPRDVFIIVLASVILVCCMYY